MVIDGVSLQRIKNYLHLFTQWWVNVSCTWQYDELLQWFIESCWNIYPAAYAAGLLQRQFNKLRTETVLVGVIA